MGIVALAEVVPTITLPANLFEALGANVGVVVPSAMVAGMGIYAIVRAAKMVPRLLGSFVK